MNAKKAVPLILCISLILSSCSVAISPKANSMAENDIPPSEIRENENILEANGSNALNLGSIHQSISGDGE